MHSSFVSDVAIYDKSADCSGSVGIWDNPVLAGNAALSDAKLAQWLAAGKSSAVSKVVDPATGEPLTVYHSTGERFTVFDVTKSRSWNGEPDYDLPGFYFTDDSQQSNDYGDTVINAWLDLKNPFEGNLHRYKQQHGLKTWRETY